MRELTTAEAAERLGVSVSRIKAMIKAGILPADKYGGRDWRIDPEAVEREAEKRRRGEAKAGRPRRGER